MSIMLKKDWQRLAPKPEHKICEYSAAPVFMDENANAGTSLIEFAKMPDSVEKVRRNT